MLLPCYRHLALLLEQLQNNVRAPGILQVSARLLKLSRRTGQQCLDHMPCLGVCHDLALDAPEGRRWHRGVCDNNGPMIRRHVFLLALRLQPIANVANLLTILLFVDRQLLVSPVASAGRSTTSLICHVIDVLVLNALAGDHEVRLFQVLEKLAARVEPRVTSAACRLSPKPIVVDDVIIVGSQVMPASSKRITLLRTLASSCCPWSGPMTSVFTW